MSRIAAVAGVAFLVSTSCGGGNAGGPEERELIVSAAASLTAVFTQIGQGFKAENAGVGVALTFGPSDGLATQIVEGAPVDVFASASPAWMDLVAHEGPGVIGRADFARNELAIVAPAGNPAGIGGVEDLAADGVRLVLAAEGVPAGDYAREILTNAGIANAALANVVSNEEDVASVVTKVLSGDADAGIVYVTDVTRELDDDLVLIEIPDDVNVFATYPIAVVTGSEEEDLAQRFVGYVLGDGQRTLAGFGFLPAS